MKSISPIAIDMGAKNTGVYLNHFEPGEDPTENGNSAGKTVVLDGQNITLSQADRTAKRHQIRTGKRRKLAKRLLLVILEQGYNLQLDSTQRKLLMGLLNRRGYTYLAEGLNEELVKQPFVAEYFVEKHADFFKDTASFFRDFLDLSNDANKCEKLRSALTLSKNDAKKAVDDNAQEFADAYINIRSVLDKQVKADKEGHKYRAVYLQDMRDDMVNSKVLKPLLDKMSISADGLANLIGNVSNLQLRVLRKYFNDEAMRASDRWHPDRLQKLFFRWVRSWHCKRESKEGKHRADLLERQNEDILQVFSTVNPRQSIPPYEDQNNRRPPKDLTLRLKPKGLDKHLPDWEEIVARLCKEYCLPATEKNVVEPVHIQSGLKENARPQTVKNVERDTKQRQVLADALHRMLDRTTKLDPYKLRWNSEGSTTPEAEAAKKLLNQHSGGQADQIIGLAKKYYAEVNLAKQGLWSDVPDGLFFRCDTNPPHKGNIQHRLVGHILQEEFALDPKTQCSDRLEEFKNNCWNQKAGRTTVRNLAAKVEEVRKDHGNAFNYIAAKIQRRQYVLASGTVTVSDAQRKRWKEYEKEHADAMKAIENAGAVADAIAKHFRHPDDHRKKYANPYSVAQLYNHLETDIRGFSKTDRWNTEENAWRGTMQSFGGESYANASRLTADSIRPFDGMLARMLDRQAQEICNMKIAQLEELKVANDAPVFLPILMEQNRFNFEQSLHAIKGLKNVSKKTRERVEKGKARQQERWQDKRSRIRAHSVCPYTGEQIGEYGEIDHIVPQSQSKKSGDVVYNSEANLIYCSGNGNQQKGDKRYALKDLHSKYLQEVFGSDNTDEIYDKIKDYVLVLGESADVVFHNLSEDGQKYLRHALFIRELDAHTFPILNTRSRTFVNGTQGYLGKQIRKLLLRKFPNAKIKTYQVGAEKVHQLRDILTDSEPEKFAKQQDKQSAFSHVIDASLVLAAALQEPKIAEELRTLNVSELAEESEKSEWLKKLPPIQADVQHIKRKPKYRKDLAATKIFKEGLYGERFIPLLLDGKDMRCGFALDNSVALKKAERVFALLQPFLYFGARSKKQPIEGDFAAWQHKAEESPRSYLYLAVDKTKALGHLQKCAKQVCDEHEVAQAEALNDLRYCVEKKSVQSMLVTKKGGKDVFVDALDKNKFAIKTKHGSVFLPALADWERLISCPIANCNGEQTTLVKCFGKSTKVKVPNEKMQTFWRDLSEQTGLSQDFLRENLRKTKGQSTELVAPETVIPKNVFMAKSKSDAKLASLKDNALLYSAFDESFVNSVDLIPAGSWNALFEEFFRKGKMQSTGRHRKVRKVFSLPVVSNPSGGFRIKRKNPLTGEEVYQVSSVEGFAAKGLSGDLSSKILINELRDSNSIAEVGVIFSQPPDSFCYFDEWRKVEITCTDLRKKVTALYYAPGSGGRFHIRVAMSFANFKELDDSITDWRGIAAELSEPKKNDGWKFKKKQFKEYFSSELLGEPRSNLFVEKVSAQQVVFTYIVSSTTQKMRDLYKNGVRVHE